MPIIDSTFLIHLDRADAAAVQAKNRMGRQPAVVPPSVAAEVLTGVQDRAQGLRSIEASFSIPEGHREWILACADLRAELAADGRLFRIPDLWIAAWARVLKTYVVTANARHYRAMGIKVWHYPTEDKPPK